MYTQKVQGMVYRCTGHLWASGQQNSAFQRTENSSTILGEKKKSLMKLMAVVEGFEIDVLS